MFILVITTLITLIPISISGLGTREVAMIYLFQQLSLPKEAAVLYSLSLFLISILLGIHGAIINVFVKTN